jgi:PAP2 superfamily
MFGELRLAYWLLLVLAGSQFALSAALGTKSPTELLGIGGLVKMLPGWVILPLLWFGVLAIEISRRKVGRPIAAMRRLTRRHRFWLLRGIMFIAIIYPLSWAFSSYKYAIPQIVPFFADPYLVAADRVLFGTDPWTFTHALIGPMGTVFLDRVYVMWFPFMMLLLGWLFFTRDRNLQVRGLLTFVLCWAVLGNVVATGLSSVGPCFYAHFYGDHSFDPLMRQLREVDEDSALVSLRAMKFLLDPETKQRLGAGISAMPSMHVAIAFLCYLVALRSTGKLSIRLVTFVFALAIMVGSVHLGWHYAVDGIVSIAAVTAMWVLMGRLVDWIEQRAQDRTSFRAEILEHFPPPLDRRDGVDFGSA